MRLYFTVNTFKNQKNYTTTSPIKNNQHVSILENRRPGAAHKDRRPILPIHPLRLEDQLILLVERQRHPQTALKHGTVSDPPLGRRKSLQGSKHDRSA